MDCSFVHADSDDVKADPCISTKDHTTGHRCLAPHARLLSLLGRRQMTPPGDATLAPAYSPVSGWLASPTSRVPSTVSTSPIFLHADLSGEKVPDSEGNAAGTGCMFRRARGTFVHCGCHPHQESEA